MKVASAGPMPGSSEKGSCGDNRWRWSRDVIWKGLWRVSLGLGVGVLVGRGDGCRFRLGVPPLILPSTLASDLACLSLQS